MAVPRDGTDQSLIDLTDDEIREVVLSDWIQLTAVLGHDQPSRLIARVLRIELERGQEARLTLVERLRGALMRAKTRESFDAAVRISASVLEQQIPSWPDLHMLGLEEYDITKLTSALETLGLSRL